MKDIEYFRKRFYIFYDYLIKKQGAVFILEQTKGVFEAAYQKKNEKMLRKLDKELDVWLREMLMLSEKEELLKILEK